MLRFLSQDLWNEIAELAKDSKVKRAAIAYVTTDDDIEFGEGDLLITDASHRAIASGETSARVLASALRNKAEVYSCSGLHAKVMVFDGVAVIGSANLSKASRENKIEAALVTDRPQIVAMARAFLEELQKPGHSDRVDKQFLERIKKIKVIRRGGRGSAKRRPMPTRRSQPSTWLVGTNDLDEDDFPNEKKILARGMEAAERQKAKASSSISWIRLTSNSKFCEQVRPGDLIIDIARTENGKRPYAVYKHAPVLLRRKEPTCTRIYYEFSRDSESSGLTWRQFKQVLKRAGFSGKIVPSTTRTLSSEISDALFDLWNQAKR